MSCRKYKTYNKILYIYSIEGELSISRWAGSKSHPFCSSVIPMSRESRDSYSSPANTGLLPGIVPSPNLHRYIRFAIVPHPRIIQDFCAEQECLSNFTSILALKFENVTWIAEMSQEIILPFPIIFSYNFKENKSLNCTSLGSQLLFLNMNAKLLLIIYIDSRYCKNW